MKTNADIIDFVLDEYLCGSDKAILYSLFVCDPTTLQKVILKPSEFREHLKELYSALPETEDRVMIVTQELREVFFKNSLAPLTTRIEAWKYRDKKVNPKSIR